MADFQPDHRGIAALMRSTEMSRAMQRITELHALPMAKVLSPDRTPYGEGYVNSWRVETGKEAISGTLRSVARLVNTADYAAAVEFGWSKEHGQWADHKGYHVLRTVADVIGS